MLLHILAICGVQKQCGADWQQGGLKKRVSVWASAAARLDEGIRDRVWFPPRLPLLQFTDLHAVLLTHTSLSPSKYANCTLSQVPP